MFAFSQIQPETTGNVSDMPVPFDSYMESTVESALHETPTAMLYRWSELKQQENDDMQTKLSADEANKLYGIGDLQFSEPINETAASLLHDRKQVEIDRNFDLQNDNHSLISKGIGMSAGMASSMIDPVNLAMMFLPVVGTAAKLGPVTELGMLGRGAMIREAISQGLIQREALTVLPRLSESLIQGASYMTLAEGPRQFFLGSEHVDAGNPLLNIASGTALAGALHLGLSSIARAWELASPAVKEAMFTHAMNQFAKGEDIDVSDIAKLDDSFVAEQLTHKDLVNEEMPWPDKWKQSDILTGPEVDQQRIELMQNKVQEIFKSALSKLRDELPQPKKQTPVIPETEPEIERTTYTSALDEIRKNNANTTAKVQELFAKSDLTRQEAAALRREAFGEQEVQNQKQQNAQDLFDKLRQENTIQNSPGVKRLAREKMERDMPNPIIKAEEIPVMQHKADVPEDSTISKVTEQAKEVEKKVKKKVKPKSIESDNQEEKPISFKQGNELVTVTKSAKQKGLWQVSHFIDNQPTGDVNVKTYAKALEVANAFKFEKVSEKPIKQEVEKPITKEPEYIYHGTAKGTDITKTGRAHYFGLKTFGSFDNFGQYVQTYIKPEKILDLNNDFEKVKQIFNWVHGPEETKLWLKEKGKTGLDDFYNDVWTDYKNL